MSHSEQHEYMDLTARRQAALRDVKQLEQQRQQLRAEARQRCKCMPEHLHSLQGLITEFERPQLDQVAAAVPSPGAPNAPPPSL